MFNFGTVKKIDIREIWANEASNFTPWLAQNLDSLGKVLGMDLELVEKEASVGDFSLDILARDLSTGHTVIIENQFGDTNHDHLGKLLTYAAGFDASIILWISENVRDEHRQTLDWLNQRSDTETQFFAINIEVFKIDDSKPAYNFKLIVTPNDWRKMKKSKTEYTVSVKGESYRSYFQSLIDELRIEHKFTNAKIGQPQSWYSFPSGYTGITFANSFAQKQKVRTELYIDFGDFEKNKHLFDWLFLRQESIENQFGESLNWERLDEKQASRIAIYRDGSIDDIENLGDIHNWSVSHLLKLKKVFSPLLKEYKKTVH